MKKSVWMIALSSLTLTLSACGQPGSGFENPFLSQITLTATPSAVTLAPGAQQHVSVIAQANGRALEAPTLQAVSTDAGLSLVPDSTGATVNVSAKTPAGTYTLPLIGTVKGGQGKSTLSVTVTGASTPPSSTTLNVSLTPSTVTLTPGGTTRIAVTTDPAATVTFSGQGSLKVDADGQAGFIVTVPATAPLGTYAITVSAKTATQTGSAVATVTVIAAKDS